MANYRVAGVLLHDTMCSSKNAWVSNITIGLTAFKPTINELCRQCSTDDASLCRRDRNGYYRLHWVPCAVLPLMTTTAAVCRCSTFSGDADLVAVVDNAKRACDVVFCTDAAVLSCTTSVRCSPFQMKAMTTVCVFSARTLASHPLLLCPLQISPSHRYICVALCHTKS